MKRIFCVLLAAVAVLAMTACGGDASVETTAAPVTTDAPATTAAPETEPAPTEPMATLLTGYYTCEGAELELFNLCGVQYGVLTVKGSDGIDLFTGMTLEPVNPGDLETVGLSETRVRISQFSAEDMGGSQVGDPSTYTIALIDGGVGFYDHTTGTPLIEGKDTDLEFKRADAPKPAPAKLTFDATAAADFIGTWSTSFQNGGLTYNVLLYFGENGRMLARIDIDGQVPNIWLGDYAYTTASSGAIEAHITRKGANDTVWPVHILLTARNGQLYLRGVRDTAGNNLLNLTCNLTRDTEVVLNVPTLG